MRLALVRSALAISVRAHRRTMRWPVTNSARSHQCGPMSANARDAPPRSSSTRGCRPSASGASPGGRCCGSGAPDRYSRPACSAGLAHGGIKAVDERDGGDPRPARAASAGAWAHIGASIAIGFSRITCLRGGEARLGEQDVKMISVWPDVDDVDVVRGDQLIGALERARHRGVAASRRALPARKRLLHERSPASRAERACTAPIDPVPAIGSTNTSRDIASQAITTSSECRSKSLSLGWPTSSVQSKSLRKHFESDLTREVWISSYAMLMAGEGSGNTSPTGAGRVLSLIRDGEAVTTCGPRATYRASPLHPLHSVSRALLAHRPRVR